MVQVGVREKNEIDGRQLTVSECGRDEALGAERALAKGSTDTPRQHRIGHNVQPVKIDQHARVTEPGHRDVG
jgi:hypothetical protein